MRVFTVTRNALAIAVVRARSADEAVALAQDMICEAAGLKEPPAAEGFDTREPDDAEMIGWIERRHDYMIAAGTDEALARLLRQV
jgi:2-keto-3-deoxy-6-phosphogluconate aldolase